ncbi:MAG: hypothetical protein LBN05_05620 [Oscillospiraceae bacterium]|jgi:energy-coupling factor transporter transmembrane protein EcfT|nr:hypothetical protein [Oscillospiraceae bacterium]
MSETLETILIIFLVTALCVGIGFLQGFLSKRESRWPGLIMPIVTFLVACVIAFGFVALRAVPNAAEVPTDIDGTVLFQQDSGEIEPSWHFFAASGGVFLVINISTAILLAIYFACRNGLKKQHEIEKMRVQDLD